MAYAQRLTLLPTHTRRQWEDPRRFWWGETLFWKTTIATGPRTNETTRNQQDKTTREPNAPEIAAGAGPPRPRNGQPKRLGNRKKPATATPIGGSRREGQGLTIRANAGGGNATSRPNPDPGGVGSRARTFRGRTRVGHLRARRPAEVRGAPGGVLPATHWTSDAPIWRTSSTPNTAVDRIRI